MNRRICITLCLLLLLIETAAHAKLVFSSERDGVPGKPSGGVPGIYIMDDDGSNLTLLIEDKSFKPYPHCWSPDGQQILFGMRDGLYVMKAYGRFAGIANPLIKTDQHSPILGGSFSPDGKSIVFGRDLFVNGKFQKYAVTVMNIETRELRIIAEVDAINCDWSPDGKQIVFDKPSAVGGGGNTIWIMGVDGQKPRPLIPAPPPGKFWTHRLKPRWSPDGQQIAFLQREYTWQPWPGLAGRALIYHAHRYVICDRDGGNIQQLGIPIDYEGSSLDWMDDGDSIVFTARADMPINEPVMPDFVWPPSYVYKYDFRTKKITQLTNDPGWDQIIDWISDDVLPVSPKGKKKVTWGTLKQ